MYKYVTRVFTLSWIFLLVRKLFIKKKVLSVGALKPGRHNNFWRIFKRNILSRKMFENFYLSLIYRCWRFFPFPPIYQCWHNFWYNKSHRTDHCHLLLVLFYYKENWNFFSIWLHSRTSFSNSIHKSLISWFAADNRCKFCKMIKPNPWMNARPPDFFLDQKYASLQWVEWIFALHAPVAVFSILSTLGKFHIFRHFVIQFSKYVYENLNRDYTWKEARVQRMNYWKNLLKLFDIFLVVRKIFWVVQII